jgi:hypothetical protein
VSATLLALRKLERDSLQQQVILRAVPKGAQQQEGLREAIEAELLGLEVQCHLHSGSGDLTLLGYGSALLEAHARLLDFIRLRNATAPLPAHWTNRDEGVNLELVDVPLDSKEAERIRQRMQQTMLSVQLLQVHRVENKLLWRDFAHNTQKLKDSKGGVEPTVLLLFHGTRATDPQLIYNGQMGFDFRYAKRGLWGHGVYFSTDASYSHNYSSAAIAPDGKPARSMFLAQVLVGESFDYGKQYQRDLKTPPAREQQGGGIPFANELYDSVQCTAVGSQNFVVYEGGRGYPSYLLTYRP